MCGSSTARLMSLFNRTACSLHSHQPYPPKWDELALGSALRVPGGACHDRFWRCCGPGKLAGHTPFVQNNDAIRKTKHLRQFRRDQHNRQTTPGECINLSIDLLLGADVDSASGFIQKEHPGIGQKPL